MNRDMFEKSSTDKIPQGQEHKATNILREHNWYFLWQSGEWHVIDCFSPTYNTNIGLFPRGTAAIAVFLQIKDLIPAEAQKIAQEYALEHFPEMFRTHTACGMKPERIHDEYNSADYQECKKIHNAIFY